MPIEIKILVNDQGGIQVGGNIDNPLQAFGVLELGKQALADHYKKLADRLVQPVGIVPPNFKID
jgi:hypothetical protein